MLVPGTAEGGAPDAVVVDVHHNSPCSRVGNVLVMGDNIGVVLPGAEEAVGHASFPLIHR